MSKYELPNLFDHIFKSVLQEALEDLNRRYSQQLVSGSNIDEVIDARSGELKLGDKIRKTDEEILSANRRVDGIIVESGDANVEVTDARQSAVKNMAFSILKNRFEDVEKDTYVPLQNSVKNADFQNEGQNWSYSGATRTYQNQKVVMASSGSSSMQMLQETADRPKAGDKIYVKVRSKIPSAGFAEAFFHIRDWVSGGTVNDFVSLPVTPSTSWHTSSRIITIPSNFVGDARFYVRAVLSDSGSGKTWEIESPMLVNLTTVFGAGQEPTKEEWEATLTSYSNSFFAGSVNQFNAREAVRSQRKQVAIEKGVEDLSQSVFSVREATEQTVKNVLKNASFTEGGDSWSPTGATATASNNVMTVTSTGSQSYAQLLQITESFKPKNGDKIYLSVKTKNNDSFVDAYIYLRDWVAGGTFNRFFALPTAVQSSFHRTSGVITVDQDFLGDARVYLRANMPSASSGKTLEIKQVMTINLTELFGEGQEPSKDEFESILASFEDGFVDTTKNLFSARDTIRKQLQHEKEIASLKTSGGSGARKRANKSTYGRRPMWVITYDDESTSIYDYAFPVHQQENVPGEFYVLPDRINTGQTFNYGEADTWDRLLAMQQASSGTIKIQHHTLQHRNTTDFTPNQLISNIEAANEIFYRQGIFPAHFAYPGGANNASNRNVLQDYFDTSVTTAGGINLFDLHPQKIGRRMMDDYSMNGHKAALDSAVSQNGLIITYQHGVHPSGTLGSFNVRTPDEMTELIQYAKSIGLDIVSMDEAMRVFAPFSYFFSETNEPIYSVQRNGVVVSAPQ